ncbi:GNAT family N-acetyltransferase [Eubacteriales bacterium OttesenSCG-928-A19]|nr:GNAT family N-acetyltransferase [Eubacteriales bacterium OttesenSCG-928-A19]
MLKISHPANAMSGVPRENAFLVLDEAGLKCGSASVIEYYNDILLPDRPLNYYINISAMTERAFDMMIGAVIARSMELHSFQPDIPGRIYVPCRPDDRQTLFALLSYGFQNDDGEFRMRRMLGPNNRIIPPPVGCLVAPVLMENEEDGQDLLHRVNRHSPTARSMEWLYRLQQEQMFLVLGVWQNNMLLGELILTAFGTEGRIEFLYTADTYRNRGVAISLITHAAEILRDRGIHSINAVVWRRNVPATTLFQSMQFENVGPMVLYPGINLG